VRTGRRERDVSALLGTQYPQATDVGVFSIHMVCEDDDLENVGMYGFAGTGGWIEYCFHQRWSGEATYNPSPSSRASEDISKVIQPSGFSSVTTRTSWRSAGPVPARMHMVEGVYESSSGKQRNMDNFWIATLDGNSTVIK
jgi:hypothetical protein